MKQVFALFAAMLLCVGAAAASVEASGTVYVYGEAKEVSIRIANETDSLQDFSVEFTAPTQFEISQSNGTIPANRSETVTLTVFPRSDLVGQTYKSKLEVTLGNERVVKQLNLVFRGAQEENEENSRDETSTDALTGLFSLFTMPDTGAGLAFNAFLAIVAAVLLVAFIARFIKRMEGR